MSIDNITSDKEVVVNFIHKVGTLLADNLRSRTIMNRLEGILHIRQTVITTGSDTIVLQSGVGRTGGKDVDNFLGPVTNFDLRGVRITIAIGGDSVDANTVFRPFMGPHVIVVTGGIRPIGIHVVKKLITSLILNDLTDITQCSIRVAIGVSSTTAFIGPRGKLVSIDLFDD